MCTVSSIQDYIKKVTEFIEQKNSNTTVVYRGEDEIYRTNCQPNIFRRNDLKKNKFFEKNLFAEMSANDLTDGQTYLEKAIDAQHGGFPSRLLDVTYNSLVALYFAVTPVITKDEDEKDGKEDGAVYIYSIKKIFCPSGENINLTYNSIVSRNLEWLCKNEIFQKNHKLIDHIKKNKRVIAQQGAFILFQGDSVTPIPKSDYVRIIIDKDGKKKIRNDLKVLFGIHTGSIYPETTNLIKEITNKSYKINSEEFNICTELQLVINTLDGELNSYYRDVINLTLKKCNENELLYKVVESEEKILEYKLDFIQLEKNICSHNQLVNNIKCEYNNIIKRFSENIMSHINEYDIEFSEEELLWGECTDAK